MDINLEKLREDLKDDSLGAFFGGGFGGAFAESFEVDALSEKELVKRAKSRGIDLEQYRI